MAQSSGRALVATSRSALHCHYFLFQCHPFQSGHERTCAKPRNCSSSRYNLKPPTPPLPPLNVRRIVNFSAKLLTIAMMRLVLFLQYLDILIFSATVSVVGCNLSCGTGRLVSFLDPTNPSSERFQYRTILEAIRAGVGLVWERDYR